MFADSAWVIFNELKPVFSPQHIVTHQAFFLVDEMTLAIFFLILEF